MRSTWQTLLRFALAMCRLFALPARVRAIKDQELAAAAAAAPVVAPPNALEGAPAEPALVGA